MNAASVVLLVLSALMFIYLGVAMFKAEWF
jgi:K+-transporting ATPase KdpF subunit